jgi:hypothetical protein
MVLKYPGTGYPPRGVTLGIAGRLDALIGEQASPTRFAEHGKHGSGRAIHPITPLDLGLFTVRRAAG